MLTIRPEQLAALSDVVRAETRRRVAQHLRREHGEAAAGLDDAALAAFVDAGIARARAYALTNERDVAWFAAMLLEVSPAFDSHPRVRALLSDPATPPDQRVRRVVESLSDQEWEEAASCR